MDQKAWIAAIVGLIVGVLLGTYICSGSGTPPTLPTDGSRGDPPPLPSSLVESMPEGAWPKSECSPGGGMGIDLLDQISTLAWNDKNAEMCTPEQWLQVYTKACEFAMNPALQGNAMGPEGACAKLNEAIAAGMNHEWQLAVDTMEQVN